MYCRKSAAHNLSITNTMPESTIPSLNIRVRTSGSNLAKYGKCECSRSRYYGRKSTLNCLLDTVFKILNKGY